MAARSGGDSIGGILEGASLSDPNPQPASTAISKRIFEVLLVAAAIFESAHMLGVFERRAALDGAAMAVVFTAAIPWVAVILGLGVTRRGNVVAKWLLLTLVAVALLTAIKIGTARWHELPILFGAVAGALQVAAAAIMLTAGRDWTRRRAGGASSAGPS